MILPIIVLFIIGAAFGSFLSVVIFRLRKEKKGIFFGKSECPYCHKNLKWYDLIPVFSYLFRLGKCAYCKKKIHISYLLLEIVSGLLFVAFYLVYPFITFGIEGILNFDFGLLLIYIYFVFVGLSLIGILFFDARYLEIPEILTLPTILLIFIVGLFLQEPSLQSMVIGGAIAGLFFGAQVWISKEKWLGAGDVQVGILMGLLFGWQLLILAVLTSYILGSVISLILLAFKKVTPKSQVPFAPFLVVGTFITIFFGEFILDIYLNSIF
jgi:leader peptidase (prepilin peptidase)/N-methyltransferase